MLDSAPRILRGSPALLLLLALVLPAPAHGKDMTYCVGGFVFDMMLSSRQQCATHADEHDNNWHFHCFVRGPDGKCRECWDEHDETCVTGFLRDHPDFQQIGRFDCARAGALPPESAEIRMEKGQPVAPPPAPPPPAPVQLRSEISHLSPGPYEIGDKVRVDARVVDSTGRPRPVERGSIILRGSDGVERSRVPVQPGPGGAVTATLDIPTGGDVTIEFQPEGIKLEARESLGAIRPEASQLRVSPCRLRGEVLAPRAGDIVMAQAPLQLRGQLRGHGAVGAGMQVVFVLSGADGRPREVPAAVAADGSASATMTPDVPSGDQEEVTLRLLGKGGAGDVCPGAPVAVRLTRLGVGLALALPGTEATCYVGRPCQVTARLLEGKSPQARTFVETAAMRATFNGEPVQSEMGGSGAERSVQFLPQQAGAADLEVIASAHGSEVRERRRLRIREPLVLAGPREVDLGDIHAGTSWDKTCRVLDLSASRGIEDQELLLAMALPAGCAARLRIRGEAGLPYEFDPAEPLRLTVGLKRTLDLCLDAPRCAAERPEPAHLTIRARSPDFPDQQAIIAVRWRVIGRSFLSCHLWWIVLSSAAALFALIVHGFVSPLRFTPDDGVRIAARQQALPRAVVRRLRELPGGRPGFYRSAAVGLREDGSATDRLRAAGLVLAAARGDVLIRCRGPLLRLNQQTRKLDEISTGKDGHAASRNAIYSAGGMFFQVT